MHLGMLNSDLRAWRKETSHPWYTSTVEEGGRVVSLVFSTCWVPATMPVCDPVTPQNINVHS
jgi:hypothetical protein